MESTEFFYLIVPLAALVAFLVILVIYYSRKVDLLSGKLDKENFSNTKSRVEHVKNFNME